MRASARDESLVSIVHGDYRLDNLMFHPTEPRVLADFAYHCMSWHIAPGAFRGIAGLDLAALGIPAENDYIALYCQRTGSGLGSGGTALGATGVAIGAGGMTVDIFQAFFGPSACQ